MPENLVGDEEMADIRSREATARGTVAPFIERARIGAKLSALDVDASLGRERRAVPSHARRRDAIEEIDTATHTFDEILRKAHAHQVSRPIVWQRVVHDLENAVHVRLRFADG